MSERVFYHHKKAAAGAMLAKLVEIAGANRPRDDEAIYPAPWANGAGEPDTPPHMAHFSDSELIDYLGTTKKGKTQIEQELQRKLYLGLRYRREQMYRTLLVVDTDLANASKHSISYFANELRGSKKQATSEGRKKLEAKLAMNAGQAEGEVIVYCPSPSMQSKLVDARLEIAENRILPLRVQRELFAYKADLDVLQQYYDELWRAYVFVSPEIFLDQNKCKAVVDEFCRHYGIMPALAYRKVRFHDFALADGVTTSLALQKIEKFLAKIELESVPPSLLGDLLGKASADNPFLSEVKSNGDVRERLTALLHITILNRATAESTSRLKKAELKTIETYCASLEMGSKPVHLAARESSGSASLEEFTSRLVTAVLAASTRASN
jgi:hypothetical protein